MNHLLRLVDDSGAWIFEIILWLLVFDVWMRVYLHYVPRRSYETDVHLKGDVARGGDLTQG